MSDPCNQRTDCTWTQDSDGDWDTACGHCFVVIDGMPHDNGMRFCCYCGKPLTEAPFNLDHEVIEWLCNE